MERLKMLSPSRRLQGKYNNNFNSNFNGFSLADQSRNIITHFFLFINLL